MIQATIRRLLNSLGYELVRRDTALSKEEAAIIQRVREFTMTSPERLVALIDAVKYVVLNQIPGAAVECGVWRGGSMMATAHTLLGLGDTRRELFLFDTFEGMPPASAHDVAFDGRTARDLLSQTPRKEGPGIWAIAGRDDVQRNMLSTGYPPQRIHLVQGRVEDTIPAQAPTSIALLRLDTDWYESTRHELVHLFARLSPFGVLIVDDYGHWQGARQAVDEFLASLPFRPFLSRLDYTGRLLIKAAPAGCCSGNL